MAPSCFSLSLVIKECSYEDQLQACIVAYITKTKQKKIRVDSSVGGKLKITDSGLTDP